MTFLQTAIEYANRGWSIFPLETKRKPHVPWKSFQEIRPTTEQIIEWWTKWPNAMLGLALGTVSGVIRVDADGVVPKEWLDKLHKTAEFTTPSGGRGFLYRSSIPVKTEVVWSGNSVHNELRVQSDGSYTVIPPSTGYEWVNEELAKIPQWLYDRTALRITEDLAKEMSPWTANPDRGTIEDAVKCFNQERCDSYTSWINVGIALHSAGDEYLPLWIAWSRGSSKFEEGVCEYLWTKFDRRGRLTSRSLIKWARDDCPSFRSPSMYEPFTDKANGRILARYGTDVIRWCNEWEDWLKWSGTHWVRNAKIHVEILYKEVFDLRYKEIITRFAQEHPGDKEQQEKRFKQLGRILHECRKQDSSRAKSAAMDFARSEPIVLLEYAGVFDKRPMLLNCTNGTLELNNAKLREHNRADMLTQLCPTSYDPEAQCAGWEKFLKEIFCDEELIRWIQKLLGYCITGVIDLHILPVWYGTGRNGKSTMVNVLMHVLGPDYVGVMPSGFLTETRNEQHPTKLTELYGKRMTFDVETKDRMQLNEELVKRLTGGDDIKARRMYENFWWFRPTHKLILATNYEPSIVGTDEAIWSRMLKIPFTQSFLGREDTKLQEKLSAEAPGILRWLVDGCLLWQKEGLRPYPTAVQTATKEYRAEQNVAARFFEEKIVKDVNGSVTKSGMFQAYSVWCLNSGLRPASNKAFAMEFRRWFGPTFISHHSKYLEVKLV